MKILENTIEYKKAVWKSLFGYIRGAANCADHGLAIGVFGI